jgi:hypothetical protein
MTTKAFNKSYATLAKDGFFYFLKPVGYNSLGDAIKYVSPEHVNNFIDDYNNFYSSAIDPHVMVENISFEKIKHEECTQFCPTTHKGTDDNLLLCPNKRATLYFDFDFMLESLKHVGQFEIAKFVCVIMKLVIDLTEPIPGQNKIHKHYNSKLLQYSDEYIKELDDYEKYNYPHYCFFMKRTETPNMGCYYKDGIHIIIPSIKLTKQNRETIYSIVKLKLLDPTDELSILLKNMYDLKESKTFYDAFDDGVISTPRLIYKSPKPPKADKSNTHINQDSVVISANRYKNYYNDINMFYIYKNNLELSSKHATLDFEGYKLFDSKSNIKMFDSVNITKELSSSMEGIIPKTAFRLDTSTLSTFSKIVKHFLSVDAIKSSMRLIKNGAGTFIGITVPKNTKVQKSVVIARETGDTETDNYIGKSKDIKRTYINEDLLYIEDIISNLNRSRVTGYVEWIRIVKCFANCAKLLDEQEFGMEMANYASMRTMRDNYDYKVFVDKFEYFYKNYKVHKNSYTMIRDELMVMLKADMPSMISIYNRDIIYNYINSIANDKLFTIFYDECTERKSEKMTSDDIASLCYLLLSNFIKVGPDGASTDSKFLVLVYDLKTNKWQMTKIKKIGDYEPIILTETLKYIKENLASLAIIFNNRFPAKLESIKHTMTEELNLPETLASEIYDKISSCSTLGSALKKKIPSEEIFKKLSTMANEVILLKRAKNYCNNTHIEISNSRINLQTIMKAFMDPSKITKIDSNPYIRGVSNGVLLLRKFAYPLLKTGYDNTFTFKRFNTKYVKFDPYDELTILILRKLKMLFIDQEHDAFIFVMRFFSMALDGCKKDNIFVILFGVGANGKSFLVDFFTSVIGNYFHPGDNKVISKKAAQSNVGSATTCINAMIGKNCICYSELDVGFIFKMDIIKRMSGGDKVSYRKLHEEETSAYINAIQFATTNYRTGTDGGSDHATWRRMIEVVFKKKLTDEDTAKEENSIYTDIADQRMMEWKDDVEYSSRMLSILVFFYCELYLTTYEKNPCDPNPKLSLFPNNTLAKDYPTVHETTDEYRKENDIIYAFIKHSVVPIKLSKNENGAYYIKGPDDTRIYYTDNLEMIPDPDLSTVLSRQELDRLRYCSRNLDQMLEKFGIYCRDLTGPMTDAQSFKSNVKNLLRPVLVENSKDRYAVFYKNNNNSHLLDTIYSMNSIDIFKSNKSTEKKEVSFDEFLSFVRERHAIIEKHTKKADDANMITDSVLKTEVYYHSFGATSSEEMEEEDEDINDILLRTSYS